MSSIILPESEKEDSQVEVVNYEATETDEQNFFLMYHLKIQPSELEAMNPEYKKWVIARFVAQKNMEQEMMQQHRLMQQIGPNLKV